MQLKYAGSGPKRDSQDDAMYSNTRSLGGVANKKPIIFQIRMAYILERLFSFFLLTLMY